MQVRHHVAQRRQIDLGGLQLLAQHALHGRHHLHAQHAFGRRQIGELRHMIGPDHTVERRETRLLGADDAQARALPHQHAARGGAQRAGGIVKRLRVHTSTRSIPPSLARCTYSGIQFSPRILFAISTTM
ncbi:hypothetical protein D3C81_1892080 [compost metagenome]